MRDGGSNRRSPLLDRRARARNNDIQARPLKSPRDKFADELGEDMRSMSIGSPSPIPMIDTELELNPGRY